MSVIAGCVGTSEPESARTVDRMLTGVHRYCPDGSPRFSAESCVFGLEMLRTDSSRGSKLPGLHVVDRSCAVFDGRLDDLEHLRAILEIDRDATEAETVFFAYRKFGEEFAAKLGGEFAVIIWDSEARKLVAARDTFAVRPLCYAISGRRLLLASDPEQIVASGLVSTIPDEQVVIDYLVWDSRSTVRTFFRDVRMVAPGHILVWSGEHIRTRPFGFDIPHFPGRTREDYWSEFQYRFDTAVARRMRSGYPVVAELSGGLDSSSIVCTADRLAQREPGLCPSIQAAAGLYPGLSCDEEPFIDAVARRVRLPVVKWDGSRGSEDELVHSSVAAPGARFIMFGGADGQMEIAHRAGARVVLSGVGGDQIAEPSGGLRDAVTEGRWREAAGMVFDRPRATGQAKAGVVAALLRSFAPQSMRRVARRFRRPTSSRSWLSPWAKTQARRRPEAYIPEGARSEIARRNWRSLTSGMHAAIMFNLQRGATRQSVEYRFPFLDFNLVALALSMPPRFWPPPWPLARLHREVLRDRLPPEIVRRHSKANFQPALELRVRRHLPSIRELLYSGTWRSEQFVDRAGARRLLADFSRETPSLGTTYGLWTVATLEAWMRAVSALDCRPT
jgi:asparagine synthase (glutamine-hydrolysing)